MAENTDIVVRIKAEGAEQFIKSLKNAGIKVDEVGAKTDRAGKKIKKNTDKMSSSFKKLGGVIGAAFATQQIIQFTKGLVRLAVDLDATEKKFKTVFGNASSIVEDFAKKNATSLGLTTSEYKKAASAAGDLLIPLGFQRDEAAKLSSGLVNLSGALSAWSGGQVDAKGVADILTKALLGEREQLKTLGIQISEADVKQRLLEKGQKSLTGSTLAQAKATATLELITEKSKDAQTAFADETKTLAEQQLILDANLKTFGENIATLLIPALNNIVGGINKVAEAYKEFVLSISQQAEASSIILKTTEQLQNRDDQLRRSIDLEKEKIESSNGFFEAERDLISLRKIQIAEEERNLIKAAFTSKKIDDESLDRRINELDLQRRLGLLKNEELALLEILLERNKILNQEKNDGADDVVENSKRTRPVIDAELKQAKENFNLTEKNTDAYFKYATQVKNLTQELKDFDSALKTIKKTTEEIEPLQGLFFSDSEGASVQGLLDDYFELFDKAQKEALKVGFSLAAGFKISSPEVKEEIEDVSKTAEEIRQERLQKSADGIRGINQLQQASFDAFLIGINNELFALETKNKKGIISEKQYQEERSKLLEKQAKVNKANAIFSAITGTAAAIVQALNSPPPASFIFAGIAGAIGAAQIAAISSQPIPKFAKGTRQVGDGYEMGEDRTLAWLNKGERVVTSEDNKKNFRLYNAIEDNDMNQLIKELAGMGLAVQFSTGSLLMDQLDTPMKTLKEIRGDNNKKGLDLNPLLNASDRQRYTLGKKLDKVNWNLERIVNTHRMTRA